MKGQINIGSVFGDMLVEYSKKPNIHNVVEIGTWNVMGSTLCIANGLRSSNKEKMFISIESCLSQYQQASQLPLPEGRGFRLSNNHCFRFDC